MAEVKLIDAPVGLFLYDGCMVLKTEYCTESDGRISPDCYIVSSGEYFWGGAKTIKERNALKVMPIKAKPVKQGRWIGKYSPYAVNLHICSVCNLHLSFIGHLSDYNYCPCCGAKMSGKEQGE